MVTALLIQPVWSLPSDVLERTTAACSPPVVGAEQYAFTVAEDAGIGTVVGSVSATDDSTVTYETQILAGFESND